MRLAELKCISVVGMGTMGRSIAPCLAAAGYWVRCYDADRRVLHQAVPLIRSLQRTLISAKLLGARQAASALKRILLFDDVAACVEGAQLVIEAAPEKLDLKLKLLGQLDALCETRVVFASNTSGLSIATLGAATSRPDKVAGFHWWNPAHLMPLVEVIKGAKTSEPTAQLLMALARKLGKEPILVRRDVPGFVGNRLQFAVFREALDLVQRGIASPQDVDTAMKSGPGLRYAFLGPLQTADLGGLDVFSNISRYLFGELCRDARPPPCLTERVKAGRFGVKSASGFYEYRGRRLEELLAERDQQLIKLLKVLRRGRVTKESTR